MQRVCVPSGWLREMPTALSLVRWRGLPLQNTLTRSSGRPPAPRKRSIGARGCAHAARYSAQPAPTGPRGRGVGTYAREQTHVIQKVLFAPFGVVPDSVLKHTGARESRDSKNSHVALPRCQPTSRHAQGCMIALELSDAMFIGALRTPVRVDERAPPAAATSNRCSWYIRNYTSRIITVPWLPGRPL